MTNRTRCGARGVAGTLAFAVCALLTGTLGAQAPRPLPFAIGERLSYETRAGRTFSGRAELWIEGPVEVQDVQTMVLRFTFSTKVGPFGVSDETTSWWDPVRRTTLRFEKRERHLLARHTEDVTIERASGHWRAADGREGDSESQTPLDELSFIYFIRTLDQAGDATLQLSRHFDADRNPTTIRFVGRDSVTTPAGTFATHVVEMRVRDARHYKGEGVIRFSLSDDVCRRPVRIESNIPGAGNVVMTLVAASPIVVGCGSPALAASAP
jgi:hypothetical protein